MRGSLKRLLILPWVLSGWGDVGDERVVVEESGDGDSKVLSTISTTRSCGGEKDAFSPTKINFHRYFSLRFWEVGMHDSRMSKMCSKSRLSHVTRSPDNCHLIVIATK